MKIIKYLLLLFSVIYIISACDDDICTTETESFLDAEMVVVDTNLIKVNFTDSLSVYSSEWNDSINYWENGKSNNYLFTLSPNDTITTIIISSRNHNSKDTVEFIHQNEIVLLSTECGFVINYKIDTFLYTENLIDSIFLVNDELTTDENGQIKIYL